MEFDSLVKQLLEVHELVIARGINRKHQNQIPASVKTKPYLKNYTPKSKHTLGTVNTAKSLTQHVRHVAPAEAADMARKYGFELPHQGNPEKQLGSTGITLAYKGPNKYSIIKK